MDIKKNTIYTIKGSSDTIEVVSHEQAQAIKRKQQQARMAFKSGSEAKINPDPNNVQRFFNNPLYKITNHSYEKYVAKIKRKKLEAEAERLQQQAQQQQENDREFD